MTHNPPARPPADATTSMTFYLGTHQPGWLATAGVPLFVSRTRIHQTRRPRRRTYPRAITRWAMDSGGFTELQRFGRWRHTAAHYAEEVRFIAEQVGRMDWVAPQDWMCEPIVINGGTIGPLRFAGTGLSVVEHQHRTVTNLLELRALAPNMPWVPVLQGWTLTDYLQCVDLYQRADVDLTREPLVGLGSVCRRQATDEATRIVTTLAGLGLRLHGFGFKTLGLRSCAHALASSDSLAWSYDARRKPPMPGHTHRNCANCQPYALRWRTRLLASLPVWQQPDLFNAGEPSHAA
ncbi:DUF7221 family queuine tRNA-ribosyltransferase-like protein [Streptodolium elevatio]|uniref:DeoxyPurine in DNA protein A domain-containing protein n=1 Tax=Streptodolium elevatio TaxID=3157996 RepID=A0ABV3DFS7_9ACTN